MAYHPITQCPYICNVDLLWHPDHKSRPVTLDYTGTDGVIKAGTPISAAGAAANNGNAIGILLRDCYDGFHAAGNVVIDGFIRQDVAAEHSGVQLTDDAKRAMSKLVFVDASGVPDPAESGGGGGGGSVPKPLTYDYMPEGYPTKTVQTTVLMEEQEVAFTENGAIYGGVLTDELSLVEGQTYTVNWDGTEYECVCSNLNGDLFIGNLSYANMGEDSGEPFLYLEAAGTFGTLDTSASHTISVKTTGEVVTPIAEEFLPPSFPAPLKTGSLLRGDADNAKWSEADADGGYGYTDGQTVIDWDGKGSGKTKVCLFDAYYYNVSEKVPSSEELIGGIAVGSTETRPLTISSDNCVAMGGIITIQGIYKDLSILVVPNDDFHFEYSVAENSIEADFPKKGVYFAKYPGSTTDFVHSLTYGNEIVHQIAEKYLPEVVRSGDKEIILSSSTSDSNKKFKITVDDSGTLTATELT